MSDRTVNESVQVQQWIEERRTIHNEATEGPWVAEYSGETGDCVIPNDAQSTREAVAVTRLFHRTADANAIADAHNMFPRALNALEAVIELIEFMETDAENCLNAGYLHASEVLLENAGDLRQAIEGAINGERG